MCPDEAGRLLLTRFFSPGHPDSGKWTIPGGVDVAGHLVGIVFAAVDVQGVLRATFDAGTTDAVRWVDLAEIASLPRVELVVDLLGRRIGRQSCSSR